MEHKPTTTLLYFMVRLKSGKGRKRHIRTGAWNSRWIVKNWNKMDCESHNSFMLKPRLPVLFRTFSTFGVGWVYRVFTLHTLCTIAPIHVWKIRNGTPCVLCFVLCFFLWMRNNNRIRVGCHDFVTTKRMPNGLAIHWFGHYDLSSAMIAISIRGQKPIKHASTHTTIRTAAHSFNRIIINSSSNSNNTDIRMQTFKFKNVVILLLAAWRAGVVFDSCEPFFEIFWALKIMISCMCWLDVAASAVFKNTFSLPPFVFSPRFPHSYSQIFFSLSMSALRSSVQAARFSLIPSHFRC